MTAYTVLLEGAGILPRFTEEGLLRVSSFMIPMGGENAILSILKEEEL